MVVLNSSYAGYLMNSNHPGIALPLLVKNLAYLKQRGEPADIVTGNSLIATCYRQIGDHLLAGKYQRDALEVAKGYFTDDVKDTNTWVVYSNLIQGRMDMISTEGNSLEMAELWELLKPINDKYSAVRYLAYLQASSYFANSGDLIKAEQILLEGSKSFLEQSPKWPENMKAIGQSDLDQGGAFVALYQGQYDRAVKLLERSQDVLAKYGYGSPTGLWIMHRLLGWAYEGLGLRDKARTYYQKAIDVLEKKRASFAVVERAAFFRPLGYPQSILGPYTHRSAPVCKQSD